MRVRVVWIGGEAVCVEGGRAGVLLGSFPTLSLSKASVVGASYKRRYTSNSHANVESDLEKRGRKGKCAIESQWRDGGRQEGWADWRWLMVVVVGGGGGSH